MHHIASDAVFLQHHGDGLRGVEGRIALDRGNGVQRHLDPIDRAPDQNLLARGMVPLCGAGNGRGQPGRAGLLLRYDVIEPSRRNGSRAVGHAQRRSGAGQRLEKDPIAIE